MKRFVTYLYEYERGRKTKNTGFIRVDERNEDVSMQICVRNFIRSHEKGKIYAYVWENKLIGISIGEVTVINGQGDLRLELEANKIGNQDYALEDIVGIGIRFQNNGYLASCWKDEVMEVVGKGDFQSEETAMIPTESVEAEVDEVPELIPAQIIMEPLEHELVTYQKMELNEIRNLPSPNWYLCNNRFLVHGFFNYGYLVLKKTSDTDGEKAYLGVPGIFEKPEMVMATLFGFPEFQALPQEIQAAKMQEIITSSKMTDKIEKSQDPKIGTFGCWLIPLQV